jgi:MFS family permease
MRALPILGTLLFSWLAAYYGEQFVKGNSDAILILVTVITVFAGFLVAIITVLGDPSLIPPGSWRIVENRRASIESELIRHTWLFIFYLVSIGVLFVGAIAKGSAFVPDAIKIWMTRGYLFFGIASFLFTFGLAGSLLKYQMARYDAEEHRRRQEANIKDDADPPARS